MFSAFRSGRLARPALGVNAEAAPILARRDAESPLEGAPEGISPVEADGLGHVFDRRLSGGKTAARFVQPQRLDKQRGRRTEMFFETTEELARRERRAPGERFNRNLFSRVFRDQG